MNLSRLLAGYFLGLLCVLFTGCGPKADMTPLAGVWSNADQSHIVILDADHGIWNLTLSEGPGPGAAYAATSGSYKAKAADLFEASVGSSSLSLKAPALAGQFPMLTITETVDGKAQASEFHRMATPSTPEIKTLGLDKPGTGRLSVRAQDTLLFSYAPKMQNGLGYYSLTSKDRPELALHLLAAKDNALFALIRNEKSGSAYLLTLAVKSGNKNQISMQTVQQSAASGEMHFTVSTGQDGVLIQEI